MSGFPTVQLGEVTTKVGSGSTPRGGEAAYKSTGTPLIRSMNVHFGGFREDGLAHIDDDQAAALRNVEVRARDVLLNITGASIGRVTIAPPHMDGARVNQHVCIIRPDRRLEPSFLRWFLASPHQQRLINSMESGATRQALTKEKILAFKVPLPSLDGQREIVAELEKQFSRVDEAVANLQRVKANLKRYKASVLKAAVEGSLVETEATLARREGRTFETGEQLLQRILEERRAKWAGRGKFSEPDAPVVHEAQSIPDGWCRSTIPHIANIASGNTPAGILDLVKPAGDVPWFKVGDMNHERNQHSMAHADAWLTHQQVEILGLRVFPPRTVIFPKRGGAIATNKKRLLSSRGACDLNVMGITPFDEVAPYFFLWFESIDLAKLSDGSNIPQINNKDMVPLIVPLPPLAEQARIVAEVDRHLSILREVEVEVEANLQRAQALRQATLAKAFANT